MAIIRANRAVDMQSTEIFYGVLSKYTPTTIEIKSGDMLARYTGSFNYDDWGNVYGQPKGYTQLYKSSVELSVTGFTFDVNEFMRAIATKTSMQLME